MLNRFYIVVSVLLTIATLQAQDKGLIEVRAEVDTAVITIGDRIIYSIIIDRQEDLRIARPGEGLNLGGFEIKSYNFPEPVQEDGRIIERFDFNISVYDTGKYAIPPFPVAYFMDDTTSKFSIIEAPAIDIYVNSVMSGDEAGELKDIKAPLEIPFDYFLWIITISVIVAFLAAVWFIYYIVKKKREKGYLFSPPPLPRPAHEIALEALDELYDTELLERKAFKEFFSRLSEILRIYLEGRYYISALEETTSEIMLEVQEHLDQYNLYAGLNELLTLSDMVKFAKFKPESEPIEKCKSFALEFVNETKLIFEESFPAENEQESSEQVIETENKLLHE